MKTKIHKLILPLSLFLNFLIVNNVIAADPRSKLRSFAVGLSLTPPISSPQEIIVNFITYALSFVGLFFIISHLYAGYQWMTSAGAEDKITPAKNRIKHSVIGIIIILVSFSVTNFINLQMYKVSCTEGEYCPVRNPQHTGNCNTDSDCADLGAMPENWSCSRYGNCEFNSCMNSGGESINNARQFLIETYGSIEDDWTNAQIYCKGHFSINHECIVNRCRIP